MAWMNRYALIFLTLASIVLSTTPSPATGPDDPVELETFLDGVVHSLMETHHVPGTVFVMVKDGAVFLSKGYGYADLESRRRRPVRVLYLDSLDVAGLGQEQEPRLLVQGLGELLARLDLEVAEVHVRQRCQVVAGHGQEEVRVQPLGGLDALGVLDRSVQSGLAAPRVAEPEVRQSLARHRLDAVRGAQILSL